MSGAIAPALAIFARKRALFVARLPSTAAAASCTSASASASLKSATRGTIAPASAMATCMSPLFVTAMFQRVKAACLRSSNVPTWRRVTCSFTELSSTLVTLLLSVLEVATPLLEEPRAFFAPFRSRFLDVLPSAVDTMVAVPAAGVASTALVATIAAPPGDRLDAGNGVSVEEEATSSAMAAAADVAPASEVGPSALTAAFVMALASCVASEIRRSASCVATTAAAPTVLGGSGVAAVNASEGSTAGDEGATPVSACNASSPETKGATPVAAAPTTARDPLDDELHRRVAAANAKTMAKSSTGAMV
mmetsp:Transcript_48809/g.136624  ORF Transcript_48809/g.136624 Transcript_48809/m.136624 type:complete len:307 (+) Transcript_48809:911-1831(+)